MPLRVSLPCRTSHTQIGSWKHLNTAPVQERSKYSQCAAWAEVSPLQAALLDFLFSARLPAAMNMILPSAVLAQRLCVREIHRRASGTYLVPQKEVERRGHRLLVLGLERRASADCVS